LIHDKVWVATQVSIWQMDGEEEKDERSTKAVQISRQETIEGTEAKVMRWCAFVLITTSQPAAKTWTYSIVFTELIRLFARPVS
jgi:MarR-like DNA-binding transcriptional regulator SgrR of sgrS sRNA